MASTMANIERTLVMFAHGTGKIIDSSSIEASKQLPSPLLGCANVKRWKLPRNLPSLQLLTYLQCYPTMSSKRDSDPGALDNVVESTSTAEDSTMAAAEAEVEAGPSEKVPAKHHQPKRLKILCPTDDELSTWTHISLDRSGATLRTVSSKDDRRSGSERRYHHIPRVEEPVEKITHETVKAIEDADGKAESGDDDEDGWVIVEK